VVTCTSFQKNEIPGFELKTQEFGSLPERLKPKYFVTRKASLNCGPNLDIKVLLTIHKNRNVGA
jgi:hypothetical protein